MDPRVELLLADAPGPAPWYWETFPGFRIGTKTWTWRRSEPSESDRRDWPVLVRDWDGATCFVPGFYTYLTRCNDETLLAWRSSLSGTVDIRFHTVTQLEAVDPNADPRNERDVVARRASECVRIPRLDVGTHDGFQARTRVETEELLLLAHWSGRNESDAALAIYSWRPASGAIAVTPQPWFSAQTHDLGYEWVTKVARDPTTNRIVGAGIRLGAFELEDDDMTVRRWLTDAWGQPLVGEDRASD